MKLSSARKMAEQMEMETRRFYETSAKRTSDAGVRQLLGDLAAEEREHINTMLRTRLDEVTERWGVKVTNVEIREIIPPREVQEAMNRQMSAERIRRAVVTESTGTREAAVNVAEGEKQAAILRAEGSKQSAILEAEGQRQAQELKAQGYAKALENIFAAAKSIDQKTMTLQYFDTLKTLGQSESTKYIFPMEFTSMIESFVKGDKKQVAKDKS